MRKPELIDFGLSHGDIQRAMAADGRRQVLQEKLIPWNMSICAAIIGYQTYIKSSSFILAIFAGLIGGVMLSMISGTIATVLLDIVWAKIRPFDHDVLEKHKKYLAALKDFEREEQRLLESFWSNLTGRDFESELAQLFGRLGYGVQLTPYGRDGGIDLFVERNGTSTIVQCKRYAAPVGVAVVRELYGVLKSANATSAILASTGGLRRA